MTLELPTSDPMETRDRDSVAVEGAIPPIEPRLLRPGETCWRVAQADRLAMLVDGAAYFAAAKAAILNAKHSIWLLAWVFDPLTRLAPDRNKKSGDPENPDRLGLLLRRLSSLNPALDVRILAWDQPWLIGLGQGFPCQRGAAYFLGSRVKYRLDHTLPRSACHHQKVLVIDGRVAFVSGGDLGADRWDTLDHEDHVPERRLPSGKRYPARHEVSLMVDGPAAEVLGALFSDRWKAVTGEVPPPPPPATKEDASPWPSVVAPDLRSQPFAVARTTPTWKKQEGAEECLALHLAGIAAAKKTIYIENQYLASRLIVEALALRLEEPDGPEIVTIGPSASPSYFDQMTMDTARTLAMNRLLDADKFGHFRAFCARTPEDHPIIVHAKIAIIDDWLLRVGSTNLNNRSMGLDSECDVAIEARDDETRMGIRAFRNREIAHFLGRQPEEVVAAIIEHGSIGSAIDALDSSPRRLRPMVKEEVGGFARFVARRSLGDPLRTDDAWRPWVRRAHIKRDIQRLLPQVQLPPEP
jgi:phosphatidylserine/phosphatidylglycerophosphate/cardiolipin synthase-like enzyme